MKHRVGIVTGGFDPLHSGHLEYFRNAKLISDTLVVGLNSDAWLQRKKGKAFLPYNEREQLIRSLKFVDDVVQFDDADDTAIDAVNQVRKKYPLADLIFANGGDRNPTNIPELKHFAEHEWISFRFGVGGADKKNSSSSILGTWTASHTERPWGYYKVLHNEMGVVKVKELVVMPGEKLSMQKHRHRAEHWFISKGVATVYTISPVNTDYELLGEYKMFDNLHIEKEQWHMLANESNTPLKIVEIQYGESCVEEDIERK